MGLRYHKRIGGNKGFGLNLSGSGISSSYRTKYGTVGSKGFSIITGIPGLSFRGGYGRGKNKGITALIMLGIIAAGFAIYYLIVILYNFTLFFLWGVKEIRKLILRQYYIWQGKREYEKKVILTEFNEENELSPASFSLEKKVEIVEIKKMNKRNSLISGTYEEFLPSGGKIKISKKSYEINYYFPGPDLRHTGTLLIIPKELIEKYIDAFIKNWEEYEDLRKSIPKGGEFVKNGLMNMEIRINGYFQGVCIASYNMPISSREKINEIIDDYRYAIIRANDVQKKLF